MDFIKDPLTHPASEELVFQKGPLSRVIAQIRFPAQDSISDQDFVRPFGELLQATYPVVKPVQNKGVVIGPQGPIETRVDTSWRFMTQDESWTVTLSREFIALETQTYEGQEDFLERLESLLGMFQRHIGASSVDRIGVRYVWRLGAEDLEELTTLVRPDLTPIYLTNFSEQIRLSMSEHEFELPDQHGRLRARWGVIPPGGTLDPAAIPPIGAPTWLLDLDGYALESRALDVESVVDEVRDFCERLHVFLLWSVTDAFVAKYSSVEPAAPL
jgi:uncharacterized protein (TIGR04255 family)